MDTVHSFQATIRARIQQLRAAMQRHEVDACLVPSADPHLSEYLPQRWKAREWLSGFTGSMGTLIVTADFAGLWADSRYWSQAESELAGTGITLMKIVSSAGMQHIDWLGERMQAGRTVAVDGAVLGLASARALESALKKNGAKLRIDLDLLEEVWQDRPSLPTPPLYEHLPPHATKPRATKLAETRAAMKSLGADWHFISTVDDIGYLFNLRGSDVNYNPVFIAHALIGLERATLFVLESKVPQSVRESLAKDGVEIAPYEQARAALAALPQDATLLIDPRRVTFGLHQSIGASVKIMEAVNPTTFAKSKKTAEEATHVRQTMEQDGAALCEFYAWLEQALDCKEREERVTELTIDERITAARARRPGFVCPSFSTIAGFNANGALPHYHATAESHATIEGNGLLLIDSGGQYLGGTTDITRVVAIGQPSDEQKRDVTLVLKGMMSLSATTFPRGTKGPMLDAIARAPIWAAGIDYGHGTGHGVGYFMNVHEGPQTISPTTPEAHMAMEPGMITSIEPGIYRPGRWGARVENLVLTQSAVTTEFGEFLRFETLTLCPIDTRCLDVSLLRADEIAWLNAYHAEVRARLSPLVDGAAKAWLDLRTQPL
jgi:Xaa-Pro aminopeptidase